MVSKNVGGGGEKHLYSWPNLHPLDYLHLIWGRCTTGSGVRKCDRFEGFNWKIFEKIPDLGALFV